MITDTKTDIELVNNIKNNVNLENSISALSERHSPLIIKVSSKYAFSLQKAGFSLDEILNEKSFIIYKAATSYKENKKNKFSTYLGNYTRWYCLNRINKNGSDDWKNLVDFPYENIAAEKKDETAKEYISYLLDSIEDKKIQKVIEMRFFSGHKLMSWSDIGKNFGISGQCANNWCQKGIKLLNARVASE